MGSLKLGAYLKRNCYNIGHTDTRTHTHAHAHAHAHEIRSYVFRPGLELAICIGGL